MCILKLLTTPEKTLGEKGALTMQVARKTLVAPEPFQDGEAAQSSSPLILHSALTEKYQERKKFLKTQKRWFNLV